MQFFFNYSLDCELPPDGRFGGPATWEIAEASIRGFIQVMTDLGMRRGATLFVYPDVATKQPSLFRKMAEAGIEIALHLNGWRYSRIKKPAWLGSMSRADQREALRMAKADVEDVIGRPCLGYRACYASANNDTFAICEELGFEWTSTSCPDSYKPAVFACWSGAWRYPHHTSHKNRLIVGDMGIYEMPMANAVRTRFQGDPDRPLDLRAETPLEIAGPGHSVFRHIIVENLDEMERRDQPVCGLFVGSHNTNPFADPQAYQHANLLAVCIAMKQLVEARQYLFVPAQFADVKRKAEEIGAF